MPRIPTTDPHANLAVQLFDQIMNQNGWGLDRAWLGIAKLLLTCEVWRDGEWRPFSVMPPGTPLLMESNNYRVTRAGMPNSYLREANLVRDYIARRLGVPSGNLCNHLGVYFQQPNIANLQPNNIRGHAFRSLVAHILATYGDPALEIREEFSARDLFQGWPLVTRSQAPNIDITVFRNGLLVAIASVRWTYRHDRVDMLDEAHSYIPPARRTNPRCGFFGITAEFATARLKKVVNQSEPVQANSVVRRLVHLHAPLATTVIGNDGVLAHMMDLQDFVRASFTWA